MPTYELEGEAEVIGLREWPVSFTCAETSPLHVHSGEVANIFARVGSTDHQLAILSVVRSWLERDADPLAVNLAIVISGINNRRDGRMAVHGPCSAHEW